MGQHVDVIKSGTVSVLMKTDGSQQVMKCLSDGDHFGEMVLLRKAPRNATNFAALSTNLPGVRPHFIERMTDRLEQLSGPAGAAGPRQT